MPASNRHSYIPSLDGLRGMAILMVIAFHYYPGVKIFSIGWAGVDLFFVLSGYLITGRLLSTLNDKDYFVKFYRNRFLRIFPLYYLVLIFFYGAIYFLAKNENSGVLSYYTLHWKSFFLFTENWTFIFYGLPHDSYLTHFWSLAIEEQFYLIWPWVLYFISPAKKRILTFGIAIAFVVIIRTLIYEQYSNYTYYYNNTFCRIDSLMAGAVLSQLSMENFRISRKWVSMLFFIFLIIIFSGIIVLQNANLFNPFMGTIGYTCLAVCYASLIYLAIQRDTPVSDFLNLPFLRFSGKISFGLYVFHWPILLIIGTRMKNWGFAHISGNTDIIVWLSAFVCIALTYGASILSYRYFESYFLKLKN